MIGTQANVSSAIGISGGGRGPVEFHSNVEPLWEEMTKRMEWPASFMRKEIKPFLYEPSSYKRPDRLVRDPMPGGWYGPGYLPYITTPRVTKRGTMRIFFRRIYAPRISDQTFEKMVDTMKAHFMCDDLLPAGGELSPAAFIGAV